MTVGLLDALEDTGFQVIAWPGWETRRRSGMFVPRGVVVHHTGPWSTVEQIVRYCITGSSALAGPLCQVLTDPDGDLHLIASGVANHAGLGGWKGLKGNPSVFGIEAIHIGKAGTPWPAKQVAATIAAAAALCRVAGCNETMVCGHKEWAPTRKIDPISIDMNWFRAQVGFELRPATPAVPPPPLPSYLSEVDVMRFTEVFATVNLDSNGRGWFDIEAPSSRVFDLAGHGSSPVDDGYWPPIILNRQERDGKVRVTVYGAPGQQQTGVFYKLAEAT
ncbi:MAG: N-acetylmuramoyl-L-alanine amidase [Chloroflexi bacterium]|nr:N-acetylmuramoyl-L-alanine amidase [Chloroflexota bacterium]